MGIQYSIGSANLAFGWVYNNTPGNYYDNVMAAYNLYYRTGIDTYLTWARTLAQRWWECSKIDKGQSWETSIAGFFASEPRSVAFAGLVLWYLDTGTDIWPGANQIVQTITGYSNPVLFHNIGELRNTLYVAGIIALDAMYNTIYYYPLRICVHAGTTARNCNRGSARANRAHQATIYMIEV